MAKDVLQSAIVRIKRENCSGGGASQVPFPFVPFEAFGRRRHLRRLATPLLGRFRRRLPEPPPTASGSLITASSSGRSAGPCGPFGCWLLHLSLTR